MKRVAVVFLLLALTLTSCSRDESEAGGRGRAGGAGQTDESEAFAGADGGEPRGETRAETPGDGERPRGSPGNAPDTATDTAPDASSGAGVPRVSTQGVIRRIPQDVVIGALEDRLDGPAPVLAAVEEFFRELAAGRIPSALLAADVRADLEQRLEYMVERADVAEEVRIGALVPVSETTYRAPVVAFGKRAGRTSGEIYVAETDGSWYISDILVDLTRINEDGERPIFEPGSDGPTLLSF
jgi:hypothetical protein